MKDDQNIYKALFDDASVGLAVNKTESGKFVFVNKAFAKITGYSLEELNTLSFWDLTPKQYELQEQVQLESMQNTGSYGPYEKHYITKAGNWVAVRLNGNRINLANGERITLSAVEDISEFEAAKEKLRLSSLAIENSSEAVVILDESKCIVSTNPAFTEITGYEFSDVKNKRLDIILSHASSFEQYAAMTKHLDELNNWRGELRLTSKWGEKLVLRTSVDSIVEHSGKVTRYVALLSDMTAAKRWEDALWKQANFDTLTGLANRHHFQTALQRHLEMTNLDEHPFSLLLIDLDEFKEVNDTLGHDVGDELLTLVGKRLLLHLRKTDFVARIGGDEFIAILPEIESPSHAGAIAEKLVHSFAKPFKTPTETLYVSASIGLVHCPSDACEPKSLVKQADQAMFMAKRMGRNRFCYFTKSMQEDALKKMTLTNALRTALSEKQLSLHFQPIIDLQSGLICKAESLLRWHHPTLGTIPPSDFISLAESAGLINDIGTWVANQAIMYRLKWGQKTHDDFQISFNVSPIQFRYENIEFWNHWIKDVKSKNLHKVLILEITESLLLNAEPSVLAQFHRLRDAGIEVAIDDFGTGYSSLAYLNKLDIDFLKIDRAFIRNLENSDNDQVLTEAIVVMAHKLGLHVVAEGVETKEQAAYLSSINCRFVQGYLYSKPLPANEFEHLLDSQK